MEDQVFHWSRRLTSLTREANAIFKTIESSEARVITLDESYTRLTALSLKQDDIFRQALRCVEVGVHRAAHVMAWSGLVDCLHALLASDQFYLLNSKLTHWKVTSVDYLRETRTDFSVIEAMEKLDILLKSERKALNGLLSKRNECAHPSDYLPSLNETLGYVTEVFSRLKRLQERYPQFSLAKATS